MTTAIVQTSKLTSRSQRPPKHAHISKLNSNPTRITLPIQISLTTQSPIYEQKSSFYQLTNPQSLTDFATPLPPTHISPKFSNTSTTLITSNLTLPYCPNQTQKKTYFVYHISLLQIRICVHLELYYLHLLWFRIGTFITRKPLPTPFPSPPHHLLRSFYHHHHQRRRCIIHHWYDHQSKAYHRLQWSFTHSTSTTPRWCRKLLEWWIMAAIYCISITCVLYLLLPPCPIFFSLPSLLLFSAMTSISSSCSYSRQYKRLIDVKL